MGYVIAPLVTRWRAMISSITAAACTLFLVPFVPSHGTSGQTGQEKRKGAAGSLALLKPGLVPDTARRAWKKRRRSRVRRSTGPDGGANGTRATY